MPINGILTVEEAAEVIGVSTSQICRYCRQGVMPAVSIGKQWLIKEEDARNFERPLRGNPTFREKRRGKD